MEELIKSIPKVLRSVPSSPELNEAAAIAAWRHSIGEGLRSHAVAIQLEEHTLVVEVPDHIWQKQLITMKDQLLFRINSILGQPLVKHIELRVNPNAASAARHKTENSAANVAQEIPLELFSAANAISDKELRQKFLETAMTALKRKMEENVNEK